MVLTSALVALTQDSLVRFEMIPPHNGSNPSYRVYLEGKKTPMVLKTMEPRATVSKTDSGMIVGTVEGDFSGAYSGSWTFGFVKYRGKLYYKYNYEARFGQRNSAIFVPHQQPIFKGYDEAFLFDSGKYFRLGKVETIDGWSSAGISGYYFVQDDGKPYVGPFNFDIENAVYRQDILIHNGVRKLTKKTLVKAKT